MGAWAWVLAAGVGLAASSDGAQEGLTSEAPTQTVVQEVESALGPIGPGEELWAGHQIVLGARSVPILGTLETRTDSYYLAKVRREEGAIHVSQITCKMEIARFAGVKVSFLPEGLPKMPASSFIFRESGDRWEAGPWVTEWEEEDVDHDGKPGATVNVEAPVCGGTVFLAGWSRAIARGVEKDGAIQGEMRASVGHRIIGTSSGCISLVAKDSEEKVKGTFAYRPLPTSTTCAHLLAAEWPVQAPEAEEKEPPQRVRKQRPRIRR